MTRDPPRRPAGLRCVAFALVLASPAIAEATWQTETIGGTSVHVYSPSAPRGPLIVALHGCAQAATVLRDRGGWEGPAEAAGAVVALPEVPGGGVLAGCWDYYGTAHTPTNRHNGPLLAITAALVGDAARGIDAAQVYLVGLSSGATQAVTTACLAPQVYAGVGMAAGPAVGTEASQASFVSTTAAAAASVCRSLAASEVAALDSQLAAIVYGASDFIVARGYGALNADMFADLYGAPAVSAFAVDALEGYAPAGTGAVRSDAVGPRVSSIEVAGMGHAFPAGTGPGPVVSYVASEGPSWPAYLLTFFAENNRRIRRDGGDVDAGSSRDAGVPRDAATRDAATRDAHTPTDGGVDGATDAGRTTDGGRVDASLDAGVAPRDGGGVLVGDAEPRGCRCARRSATGCAAILLLLPLLLMRRRPNPSATD